MNEHTLVERLNIPWPDYETDEVTLPAWVIELCAEGAARIADLEAQLAELAAENERLRKDAERYRALRDGSLDDLAVVRGLGVVDYGLNVVLYTYLKEVEGDEMDNAIDAARRALKEVSDERA